MNSKCKHLWREDLGLIPPPHSSHGPSAGVRGGSRARASSCALLSSWGRSPAEWAPRTWHRWSRYVTHSYDTSPPAFCWTPETPASRSPSPLHAQSGDTSLRWTCQSPSGSLRRVHQLKWNSSLVYVLSFKYDYFASRVCIYLLSVIPLWFMNMYGTTLFFQQCLWLTEFGLYQGPSTRPGPGYIISDITKETSDNIKTRNKYFAIVRSNVMIRL